MLAAVDWTQVAAVTTGLVALATLALAIATFKLVGTTKEELQVVRREAEATEKQAELTARSLSASSRPWLTAHLDEIRLGDGTYSTVAVYASSRIGAQGVEGHVALRNSGNGLAVIPKDASFVWGRDGSGRPFGKTAFLFPRSSILAPGEFTVVEFFVRDVSVEGFIGGQYGSDFYAHVLYTDADGGQPVVASFRVAAGPDPTVFEISYRHLDAVPALADGRTFEETEPFAIVRPGLPG